MQTNDTAILVPLDGSPLSESALGYAIAVANALPATLILLGVLEPQPPVDLLTARAGPEAERRYREYLDGVARRVGAQGMAVEVNVRTGRAAEQIMEAIEQTQPDLLVMSTHGRSGVTRWFYGSVASRLAHEAPLPTLLVGLKAAERSQSAQAIKRILVPLDGSELAESALEVAGKIARGTGAELVLAEVIWWASQTFMFDMPASTIDQIHRELVQSAEESLARAAAQLDTGQAVKTRVLRGPPAQTLIDFVADEGIDLVVIASHGRTGIARAALGSVADRMIQSRAPVLLVRPNAQAKTRREHLRQIGRSPRGRAEWKRAESRLEFRTGAAWPWKRQPARGNLAVESSRTKGDLRMERTGALALGMAAWLGVAVVAVLVVNTWSDDNQVLAFIPIVAAVVAAWLVGEWVTDHAFVQQHEEEAT